MAEKIQYLGTGRRKTSVARVRLVPGEAGITINGKDMRDYFGGVGLPTTLEELGMGSVSKERLYEVAKASTAEGETIHNMPFKVTADDVFAAILVADELGKN